MHDLVNYRSGLATSVICLNALGHFGEQLRSRGIKVDVIGMEGGIVRTLWRLSRKLRSMRPDVVHCHNLQSFAYSGLACGMQLNVPMVLTKHGTVFPAGLAAFIARRLARHSSVICVSEEVLKLYREWQDCSHESAYHIPNGLDLRLMMWPPILSRHGDGSGGVSTLWSSEQ